MQENLINEKESIKNIKVGDKLTTFEISEFMAHTIKREIQIKEIHNDKLVFSCKGKRKRYYFDPRKNAVFKSWNLPFIADSDTNSFIGNAQINLIGDPEVIKKYFDNKQLNPEFNDYSRIIVYKADDRTKTTKIYEGDLNV
ncbi:MAG: hypothetical protein CMH64_01640 [Nanoarchaeota archaeon]|jgi:hypothetical protein|nr:hypothetical protein [Nanoarchaeota archaeon]|tara:strand:- start:362 stop:784 length:423 start_codon:yes stop_codon:yes gene_type:complete